PGLDPAIASRAVPLRSRTGVNAVHPRRSLLAVVGAVALVILGGMLTSPHPALPQAPDVKIDITGTGAKKSNIAVPEFPPLTPDPNGLAKRLPEVVGKDLTFSALFSVVSGIPALPANNPAATRDAWASLAAAGAHAGLHSLLTVQGDRVQVEMRLYDLTSPEFRQIASNKFEMP